MTKPKPPVQRFYRTDRVRKLGGDYTFAGEVVAAFAKTSGAERVVVENAHGILHIFNPAQLEFDKQESAEPEAPS